MQEQIARVSDVCKNRLDIGITPTLARTGGYALCSELTLCFKAGFAIQKVLKNTSDDFRFLRYNNKVIAFPTVAEHSEMPVGDTLLHTLADTPFHIIGNAAAFLLGERCKNGHHQFAVTTHGVDVFFFKSYLNTYVF